MLGESFDYQIAITPKGGGAILATLPANIVSGISWERKLDVYSTAQIDLYFGAECDCSILAQELLILRDGIPVWLGPITYLEFGRYTGFIQARDLSAWLSWRLIHEDHPKEEYLLVSLAKQYVLDGLKPDSLNIKVVVGDGVKTGVRESLASDYLVCVNELDELLRTDVDMITVGRTIYLYGTEVDQRLLNPFTDNDFLGDLRVVRDGLSMVNRAVVNGDRTLWGVYPASGLEGDVRYGLKEKVFVETSILDEKSLVDAARTRYDLLKIPYTSISAPSGIRLNPKANVNINDLIPGFRQRISLTDLCIQVSSIFRLLEVKVDVSDKLESVKVSYQTLGSESN
jgi:hypothetical protein